MGEGEGRNIGESIERNLGRCVYTLLAATSGWLNNDIIYGVVKYLHLA